VACAKALAVAATDLARSGERAERPCFCASVHSETEASQCSCQHFGLFGGHFFAAAVAGAAGLGGGGCGAAGLGGEGVVAVSRGGGGAVGFGGGGVVGVETRVISGFGCECG
jgi:hypothetical protein